jgi:hypothetical protein
LSRGVRKLGFYLCVCACLTVFCWLGCIVSSLGCNVLPCVVACRGGSLGPRTSCNTRPETPARAMTCRRGRRGKHRRAQHRVCPQSTREHCLFLASVHGSLGKREAVSFPEDVGIKTPKAVVHESPPARSSRQLHSASRLPHGLRDGQPGATHIKAGRSKNCSKDLVPQLSEEVCDNVACR